MTDKPNNQVSDSDTLAEIIRIAGHRESPPIEDAERIFSAAKSALDGKLRRRRSYRRNVGFALAASIAIIAVSIGTLLQPDNSPASAGQPFASIDRVIGEVEFRNGDNANWLPARQDNREPFGTSIIRTLDNGMAGILVNDTISLRLAQSTTVELLSATSLRLVSGKIYIDSDLSQSPIEVLTNAGKARDIGTKFEVKYIDKQYRLRVRDGLVLLETESETLSGDPGDELTILSSGRVERRLLAANDPDWLWTESLAPVPDIDGKPVSYLLAWVERETGRAVSYEDPLLESKAAATILHGSVGDMPPLDILSMMLYTTDLRYELMDDGTILVYSKRSP